MTMPDPCTWHAGLISCRGGKRERRPSFRGLLPEHPILALPRDRESADIFDTFLAREAGGLAGILVEPLVQGAGGMLFYDAAVLRRLRRAADRYGLLLIFDEIFIGFGRIGTMFACEQAGVVPDIITLSRALTGGTVALAATAASRAVFDSFWSDNPAHALMHGPTFMANPLACAGAGASLDLFAHEDRLTQAATISATLERDLAPCRTMPGVCDVRVLGAIGVVELERITDLNALYRQFVAAGVWVRPFRNIVYLTSALMIDAAELSFLTGRVVDVLDRHTRD